MSSLPLRREGVSDSDYALWLELVEQSGRYASPRSRTAEARAAASRVLGLSQSVARGARVPRRLPTFDELRMHWRLQPLVDSTRRSGTGAGAVAANSASDPSTARARARALQIGSPGTEREAGRRPETGHLSTPERQADEITGRTDTPALRDGSLEGPPDGYMGTFSDRPPRLMYTRGVTQAGGLSQVILSALPRYHVTNPACIKSHEKTCLICLLDFRESELLIRLTCLHQYHSECCQSWFALSTKCPTCRMDVRQGFANASIYHSPISATTSTATSDATAEGGSGGGLMGTATASDGGQRRSLLNNHLTNHVAPAIAAAAGAARAAASRAASAAAAASCGTRTTEIPVLEGTSAQSIPTFPLSATLPQSRAFPRSEGDEEAAAPTGCCLPLPLGARSFTLPIPLKSQILSVSLGLSNAISSALFAASVFFDPRCQNIGAVSTPANAVIGTGVEA